LVEIYCSEGVFLRKLISVPVAGALTPVYECSPPSLKVFIYLDDKHLDILTNIVREHEIQKVIDIGCGSGWHALQMHRHFQKSGLESVQVYGVDSNNKEHFSPDTKLPFVNTADATQIVGESSQTLFVSIWPWAQYYIDQPGKPVDAWAGNLIQNPNGAVQALCPVGKTSSGDDYPIHPHWIHAVIERNPESRVLHIGNANDATVATQAIFDGYILHDYKLDGSTVLLLKYRRPEGSFKRRRIEYGGYM
jgi:SAM-dependent methyltransferase